ncbi:hypothetical protein ACFCXR_00005, partial [Streptomyces noursei]
MANALIHAEDVLAPRIKAMYPADVTLVAGMQASGVPYLGTSLVQSLNFAAAARVRDRFDVPVNVHFGAFDNAPHEAVSDAASGPVLAKGGYWVFGSQLVDYVVQAAVPGVSGRLPARLFCLQVVTDNRREAEQAPDPRRSRPLAGWRCPLDARHPHVAGSLSEYAGGLLRMADVLLSDPRHFFRSYSAGELGRLMTA